MRFARLIVLVAMLVPLSGCGSGDPPTSEEPDAPLIATLGDSITAGAPRWSPNEEVRELLIRERATEKSQWQYWADEALGGAFRFRNCGAEGDRTDELEARLEECADHAEILVVQGGTNDIGQGRAPAAAATNIREMVHRAQDAGLVALVTTVPPINKRHTEWAPQIRRLNELILALAREEDVSVIDFFHTLEDPHRPGHMRAQWTADGVHPTIEGYGRIGRAAARELDATVSRRQEASARGRARPAA